MQITQNYVEKKPRLEDHLKSTNFVIFLKFWIALRWEGIVTTDMGNSRPESKKHPLMFYSVKTAYQAVNRESNILLPVPHIKQD